MPASLAPELKRCIAIYLDGGRSLLDGDRRFVPATWEIDEAVDPAAYRLTGELSLRLAEYTRGDRYRGRTSGRSPTRWSSPPASP